MGGRRYNDLKIPTSQLNPKQPHNRTSELLSNAQTTPGPCLSLLSSHGNHLVPACARHARNNCLGSFSKRASLVRGEALLPAPCPCAPSDAPHGSSPVPVERVHGKVREVVPWRHSLVVSWAEELDARLAGSLVHGVVHAARLLGERVAPAGRAGTRSVQVALVGGSGRSGNGFVVDRGQCEHWKMMRKRAVQRRNENIV